MKFTDTSPDDILNGNSPEATTPPRFHVVLVEPEIPQNTGNIGRTCVGLGADLHLVGELGFKISDKNLKRAGLDYWQHLRWKHHASVEDWQAEVKDLKRVFYFSAFATRDFFSESFQEGDSFVFGRETRGLDPELLQRNKDQALLIPILGPVRGYNIATAVAMVLSEAHRQIVSKKAE